KRWSRTMRSWCRGGPKAWRSRRIRSRVRMARIVRRSVRGRKPRVTNSGKRWGARRAPRGWRRGPPGLGGESFGERAYTSVGKHFDEARVFFRIHGVVEFSFPGEIFVDAVADVFGNHTLGGCEGRVKDGF